MATFPFRKEIRMIPNPTYKTSGCGCGGSGAVSATPCGCGGADCAACQGQGIVRPRFFAGQLLTEDDLQLLTEYVGQKDRLHNRQLFGAGVVCGLEVTCHPCGEGRLLVHPGYALDCCGNDLTLACRQTLDINAMVRALRRDQLGGYDCGDPCPDPGSEVIRPTTPVRGTNQLEYGPVTPAPEPLRYCLYVRYCEQLSDPVMPYSTGDDCGALSCEPTRVREGVQFELRCRPKGDAANALLQRLCACLGDLNRLPLVYRSLQALQRSNRSAQTILITTDTGPAPRPLEGIASDVAKAFSEVRDWLLERLSNAPYLTDCTLRNKVHAMALPTFGKQMTEAETRSFVAATEPLIEVFINYLRDCLCRAVNPACVPCNDTAVLLACLEVDDCQVVKVCNLERTFVLSPSAVRYWLPPLQLLGNLLERLCCDPLDVLLTEGSKQSVNLGIGEFDITRLFKQEVMRILEDSSCMLGSETLKGHIDSLFAAKPNQPAQPASEETPQADAIRAAAIKEEAAKAAASKAAALKEEVEKARLATAAAVNAEAAKTAAATAQIVKLEAELAEARKAALPESAPAPVPAAESAKKDSSAAAAVEVKASPGAAKKLTGMPKRTRARKQATAETKAEPDAIATVEPPSDTVSKRLVVRTKTKRAKGAKT
jgi:hypothetical protein